VTGQWGKAGQRRQPKEITKRRQIILAERRRRKTLADQQDHEAYQRWRAGLVCPARITAALNLAGLYGPDVDRQCLAEEPEVDQWEAGERYPTWEQLRALADLTGKPPRWFTSSHQPPIPIWETSLWFHMSRAQQRAADREPAPVMRYPRAVLDARPPAPVDMPEHGPAVDGDQR
jgi:hypothetical protein